MSKRQVMEGSVMNQCGINNCDKPAFVEFTWLATVVEGGIPFVRCLNHFEIDAKNLINVARE